MIDKDKLLNQIDREIHALKVVMIGNSINTKSYKYGISLLEHLKSKINNGDFNK